MRKTRRRLISLLFALILVFLGISGCARSEAPEITPSAPPDPAPTPAAVFAPDPVAEPTPDYTPEPTPPPILERWNELYEENPDLVGWISVPDTRVDYPVVQGEDNEFYLEHDFNKNPSVAGVPFLEAYADLFAERQSLCLNGHCLRDGTMFSDLHKYKSLDYYVEHPYFTFDSLYEENDYVIFAVFYMAGNESDEYFYYYLYPYFSSDEWFQYHIDQLRYRSIFITPVEVTTDDRLVLLSTCTYETDNLRLIVAGRRLREGEEKDFDLSASILNSNPLYPRKWYDALGGEPPEYIG